MSKKNNVRDIALDVLLQCKQRHIFVNLALKNDRNFIKLKAIDKAFGYRLIYGVLQNRLLIDYQISRYLKDTTKKIHPVVKNILRLAGYQLLMMDKVPAHAVCNESVKQCKSRGFSGMASFVNAITRKLATAQTGLHLPPESKNQLDFLTIKYSHPPWLVKKWLADRGSIVTQKILKANNKIVPPAIRINPAKTNIDQITEQLTSNGLTVTKGKLEPKLSLYLAGGGDITATEQFQQGLITIQDEGAVHAVTRLQVAPGMRVLDMCSAPGGKAVLISNLIRNTGEILAVDIHQHRLNLIREVSQRMEATNIRTLLADATELDFKEVGLFDRILLDAPCTGLGTLRTKPEIRWYRQYPDIEAAAALQTRLLSTAATLLKPDGLMVYCTCSNEKEETSHIVKKCAKLSLVSEEQLLPFQYGTEGFYIAVLTSSSC